MLGIIIGIASIMAIVSTILGTNQEIKDKLVGGDNFSVEVRLHENDFPMDLQYSQIPESVRAVDQTMLKAIEAIDKVEAATVYKMVDFFQFNYQDRELSASLFGVDQKYLEIKDYNLLLGRYFNQEELANRSKLVLVDESLVQNLKLDDPIGKILDLKGDAYTIIGVLANQQGKKIEAENFGEYHMQTMNDGSFASKIFLPISNWDSLFKFDEPTQVIIKAAKADDMPEAGKLTADYLNDQFALHEGEVEYKASDVFEQAQHLQELASATRQQLIWIAGISLLVGGIGVMNIMLVSVTERTREIGLKKAIGAKKKHILWQFLIEAAVLTALGGLIGVVGGIGFAYLISYFSQMPVQISLPVSIIAVLFSMLIGLVFGFLPARKAAQLDPIVALRHD